MSRQGTIRRYTLIIEKINFGQFPSFMQIQDHLDEFGFSVSKRTIERDFEAIRNEFGLEITFNRHKEGYFIDEENSINIESFIRFLEIVNTAELLTESLSDSKETLNYISFDQSGGLKGIDHLPKILLAIREHRLMRITHHTFYSEKARKFKVEPYMLKEYQNRWYIIAIVRGMNQQRTFAIDRLEEVEVLTETFAPTKRIEVEDNFRNVIGLVYSEHELQDVELSFTAFQGNYIRSLPIHSSQEILVDNDVEFRIKLRIKPNYEFTQKILMHGNTVHVLKPEWLREELKGILKKTLENYGD
jgi:predicted DNA-binding transcriptional regulator YafY